MLSHVRKEPPCLARPSPCSPPAAKRLLERVFVNYSRYFDAVAGDGLYFEAPFINFCREHHKHVVVVVQGDHRLLLQDAEGLFVVRQPCLGSGPSSRPRPVSYCCPGGLPPLRAIPGP